MADSVARSIISQAGALRRSHPRASALDILDQVMEGRHGSDLNFEADVGQPVGDWTDPASPFGELLRCAFAADEVSADAATLWTSDDPNEAREADALVDAWQRRVVERFAERYKLWGA